MTKIADVQTVVLTKLRERLFGVSRRNRLLRFRPTMQSVNLTHASVPLSLDINDIRPDQILTWDDRFANQVAGGKAFALNHYLNFNEALYLASQLERLIAETKRDEAEYGFAQLRLVACFLNWTNLKESPRQTYSSPLVLVPVKLRKRKGIRDKFLLEAASSTADVNPVVRHHVKQLYDIHLPASIDLSVTSLDDLYADFARQVEASEPAVSLKKIARPPVAAIHEKARRRLDQYQRRARLSGRGVRSYLDLDYSYDPANYHPLGIKLFNAKIRPAPTHLDTILKDVPRPRSFAAPTPPEVNPPVAEKVRQFDELEAGGGKDPYAWTFDLCSVTLANFRYQRMSLVRDYDALLENSIPNPAFAAAFSLTPRGAQPPSVEARPVDDRFDVVACDPTQARSIAEAGRGRSFIIQGPPGTGKSQTITNLIADYVARSKRVLFVCEKRAAIDVVYARLRQCGLADLCCLIHDSQADKKAFVMDLKKTYENLLELANGESSPPDREHAVQQLKDSLTPLLGFDQAMRCQPASIGMSVRGLLERCIELRRALPQLDVLDQEKLPDYATWSRDQPAIERFLDRLRDVAGTTVLAQQPLRILSPRVTSLDRPLHEILDVAEHATAWIEEIETCLRDSGVSREYWETLAQAQRTVEHARRLRPLAEAHLLRVLDAEHPDAIWLEGEFPRLEQAEQALEAAEQENSQWIDKLSAVETGLAWEQAQALAGSPLPWLRPSWWRLRGVLRQCYNFQAHKIRPSWAQVLAQLAKEHELRWEQVEHHRQMAERLGVPPDDITQLLRVVTDLSAHRLRQTPDVAGLHARLLGSSDAEQAILRASAAGDVFAHLQTSLARISDDAAEMPLEELRNCLVRIADDPEGARDLVSCLEELQSCGEAVVWAIRSLPYPPERLEAAVAHGSLATLYRRDPSLAQFTADTYGGAVDQMQACYATWLGTNARVVADRVRQRFLDKVRVSELPAAKLTRDEKLLKDRYRRGRRELEHEFGKQMRYKAVRDLVADESGEVIDDLKPVWLMSPLSVSDTLPLATDRFDVVIFDEASQIALEEAVPALFRAPQAIIVGDEMQLPPTDFFSAKQAVDDDDDLLIESDGERVSYHLDAGSFLSHAAKNLPATMLGWHYRSRSESLISFSNWAFYDGRLLSVPEESRANVRRQSVVATVASDGQAGAEALLERPISLHRLSHGVYRNRRNRGEAEYIAKMVRTLLANEGGQTIGIVAFSEAQQDEIEQALNQLAGDDDAFREALDRELQREEDGQFVGLLVKNLENIQGDERDIVVLSVCYGPRPDGKMLMNFGPINKRGGEKRLNVAFSRAKRHMAVVCSFDAAEITNDDNDGANCLKNYLSYAEAVSVGDATEAERICRSMAPWVRRDADGTSHDRDVVAEQLAEALIEAGLSIDRAIGQSYFRCDLAVYLEGDRKYRLGILVDNNSYYRQSDLLERDLMRPRLLEAFGWKIELVLAKDWYADPDRVLARLLHAVRD